MLGLTFVTHFIIVSFGVVHALKCRGFRSIPKSKSVANSQLTAANSFSELPIEVFGWSSALTSDFLTNYLQKKKPLLIRQAIPNFATTVPLHYEGLIALASDDDVFARLYKMKGKTILKEYGPFERTAFNKLKLSSKWSLLVQELDRHIPAVADLWYKHFSFMPNWRRDDIMISYSVPGASIGAHVDNYDVFLVQGSGTRRWSIENSFLSESDEKRREVKGSDTRLLRDFSPAMSWDLNPGDMLYLPPRIPHHGVTTGKVPGTTISVGFRAPNYKSLITALWDDISTSSAITEEEAFYRDGADLLVPPTSPGEISSQARSTIRSFVTDKLTDRLGNETYFNNWLGKHLTTPLRYHLREPRPFFLASYQDKQQEVHAAHTKKGLTNDDYDDNFTDDDDTEDNDIEEELDEESAELPYAVRSEHRVALQRVFPDAEAVLQAVAAGECALRRAEGVRMAYIGDTLFIDGEAFCAQRAAVAFLCDSNIISACQLVPEATQLLITLLKRGFFYPVQNETITQAYRPYYSGRY